MRRRGAGAAVVGTFAAAVLGLARLVMTLAALIALLIGIAIVLHDVGANPSNSVVKGLHEGANFFAGSFTGLVRIKDHADRELTLDWGIALVVYLVVGAVLSRLIAGLAPRRPVVSRSRRGAAPSY